MQGKSGTDVERKVKSEYVDFEDAITKTGHGKFHYCLLLGCALCLASTVCELYGTSYLIPAAQCDFNMTMQQKGLLGSIGLAGLICSSQLWGYLADSIGRRKILVLTLAMDAVCAIVSSLAPDFYSFLVVRFFCGFFICGASAVVYVYIGEFHGEAGRAKYIILLSVVVSVASIAQPGLAWLVIPRDWELELPWITFNSWRVFVVACSVPSILACLYLLLWLPESPRYLLDQGKQQEALTIMRRMYSLNTNNKQENFPVHHIVMENITEEKEDNETKKSTLNVLKGIFRQVLLVFQKPYLLSTIQICLLQFGQFICFNSLSLWGPEIFNKMGDFTSANPEKYITVCEVLNIPLHNSVDTDGMNINSSITQSDCITSVDPMAFKNTLIIAVTASIGGLLLGYVVNYVGKRNFIIILLLTGCSCGLGLNFANTSTLVLILSCGFITFSELATNLVSTVTIDIFPTHLRATAVCISLMMGRIGGICGSLIIGALVELSCGSVFYTFSGVLLVCSVMSWFLPGSDKKKIG